jgi:hypothetical protein
MNDYLTAPGIEAVQHGAKSRRIDVAGEAQLCRTPTEPASDHALLFGVKSSRQYFSS